MKPQTPITALCAVTVACLFVSPVYAGPHRHEVIRREFNQQRRVHRGILDHELTPKEIASLELAEARIKYQERQDLLKNDGYLTAAETAQLNRELNSLSKRIYQDKHN